MIGIFARNLGAIFLGLIAGFVFIIATEAFSAVVHPFPLDADPNDFETCVAHVARYPAWVLGCVVPLWGFAMFGSVWTATRLGTNRNMVNGIVVWCLLFIAAAINLSILPYPWWFKLATVLMLHLCGLVGYRMARRKITASMSAQVR